MNSSLTSHRITKHNGRGIHPFRHSGAMVAPLPFLTDVARAGYSAGRYVGSFVAVCGPFGSEIATFAAQLYEAACRETRRAAAEARVASGALRADAPVFLPGT